MGLGRGWRPKITELELPGGSGGLWVFDPHFSLSTLPPHPFFGRPGDRFDPPPLRIRPIDRAGLRVVEALGQNSGGGPFEFLWTIRNFFIPHSLLLDSPSIWGRGCANDFFLIFSKLSILNHSTFFWTAQKIGGGEFNGVFREIFRNTFPLFSYTNPTFLKGRGGIGADHSYEIRIIRILFPGKNPPIFTHFIL